MRKTAFTLVELLVVVAILCVLFALLFPVVSMMREYARRTICINNLRQLGIIIGTYSADSGGELPGICWYEGGMYTNDNLSRLYPDYTTEFKSFVCPATRNIVENVNDLKRSANSRTGRGISYEYIKSKTVRWGMSRGDYKGSSPVLYDTDNRGDPGHIDADDNHVKIISGGMLFPDMSIDWVKAEYWNSTIYDNIPRP
jgi:prepilin-type N-terminal cleavage/methylation domain-containing protein